MAHAFGSIRSRPRARGSEITASSLSLVRELVARIESGEVLDDLPAKARLGGYLSMLLDSTIDVPANRFSPKKVSQLARLFRRHPGLSAESMLGATIVEFGCGGQNPLAGLVLLVALGAGHCIGVDLEPPANTRVAARGLFRCATALMTAPSVFGLGPIPRALVRKRLEGFDLVTLHNGDLAGIDAERIEFRLASICESGIDTASVDITTSVSTFEHLPDVDSAIAELARITRPGGLGVHLVDGIDHRSYPDLARHPLRFLTEQPDVEMVDGCNRIRPDHFVAAFERHGFEVVGVDLVRRVELSADFVELLVEPFRSMPKDVLERAGLTLHVRRI